MFSDVPKNRSTLRFCPLDKQFDLPAALVQSTDRKRIEPGAVGEERERLVGLRIFVANVSQVVRVVALSSHTVQNYGWVSDDAERSTRRRGIETQGTEGISHDRRTSP